MSPEVHEVIAKGGPWTGMLVTAMVLWLPVLLVLVVLQRIRLNRLARIAMDRSPRDLSRDPRGDHIARTCRLMLGPLTGGALGALWVGLWWAVVVVAALASRHAPIDLLRLDHPGYLDTLTANRTMQEVVGHHSAILITRSYIGILGIPALMISLLSLDQMVFRPRTRWLDEVRLQWWERERLCALPPAEAVEDLAGRSRARFSWWGLTFNWIWLAAKKLKGATLVILGLHLLIGVVAGVAAPVVGAHSQTGLDPQPPPPAAHTARAFLATTALPFMLGLGVSLWVGLKGTGRVVARRLEALRDREANQ